jgi:RNA polymerase sigma factor (sigma-70 family)
VQRGDGDQALPDRAFPQCEDRAGARALPAEEAIGLMRTADYDADGPLEYQADGQRPSADVLLFERELGPRPDIDVPAPSTARLPAAIAARSVPSAEDEALSKFSQSEVHAALAALPMGFRVAIYLVDAEGYSYRDAAEVIGVPIGTVMSRLHRARKRVRQQLTAGRQPCPCN